MMIRYPLPEEAIPPVPYEDETPLWLVLDESIAEVQAQQQAKLCRAIENAILIGALLWIVAIVIWLAW